MFFRCKSLISLPDISKWNTKNVKSVVYMFANCVSLISLPDISKCNAHNINEMSYLFSDCFSVSIFPNISNWNYYNENDINKTPDYHLINKFDTLKRGITGSGMIEKYRSSYDHDDHFMKILFAQYKRIYG